MGQRRAGSASLPPCYATVHLGLEKVAQEEITTDLGAEVKKSACGIVVFRPKAMSSDVLTLRTVEDVYLYAWGTDKLTYRALDLEKIRKWTAKEADWQQLFRIHHALRPKPKTRPTYRLVTQMSGQHGYRRIDARKALAEGLAGKIPDTWRHAEDNASLEIWLTIQGATAICGVRLSDRTMRHRSYKREHQPASLRPTVAAAMIRLAEIKPKQTLLDPMCGAGTILAEAWLWAKEHGVKPIHVWGGDESVSALLAACPNLRSLGDTHLCRWDAKSLPLRDRSVDCVICNPPFGKQLSSPEQIAPMYRELVREFSRVLKPRGKAVILASDPHALRDAAIEAQWNRQQQYRIRILGQVAYLSVWQPSFATY